MKRTIITLLFVIGIFVTAQPERAEALYLPDLSTGLARQYGDFYSYSLPILNYVYNSGDTTLNSGDPYYVASGPGQLADDIVIMTGSEGDAANTTGFEDAYAVPNNYNPYSTITYADPTSNNGIYADNSTTWDMNIDALVAYLDGDIPIFYFNNNETGGDQDLYIIATLTIWSSSTSAVYGIYYLTDPTTSYELPAEDNPGDLLPTTGYVLSGGDVEYDGEIFSHNLGANNAAYAAILPALNEFLAAWTDDSIYDMISLEITTSQVDNGYEQAFIGRGTYGDTTTVPEPSTWLLLGLGMLCLPLVRRFRRS
ncbi:protein of unknown function DUF1555 [Pseudodesulfovibrio mercurii]|uniref:Ice-binding protein C-terminal domain-containing protein n=1 Tax=Pseudodesulfovibrio mercurii TaxID=641491 RepID=F0JJ68_9BACT|nr:PEP-CTERM sorting domain-containing protein [Pseudodesulfovibrio mercurii]EGB15967.1 protein of unknown function DUF1555 [Pseudodesulfovibrio mercurii]